MISGLDDTLIALIRSHPTIIVGTCDRALVPSIARGFGARVLDGGAAVDVLVSCWPGPQTRANLEDNGRIAVTFTAPETFQSYQIKGRATDRDDCTEADLDLAADFTKVIRERIIRVGEPPDLVRVTFSPRGLFRVRIDPEAVFLQTPGRHAGQRL